MITSSRSTDAEIEAAGYVTGPRYIDPEHGIDWGIILWDCPSCGRSRYCPGPTDADPPLCCHDLPMTPRRNRR